MTVGSTLDAQKFERIAALGWHPDGHEHDFVPACNLCGSARHAEVARRDRYGFPSRYHVCLDCGLGFLSPRLTAAEYAAFYKSVYRPLITAHHGELVDARTMNDRQRRDGRDILVFLEGRLDRTPAAILDVGGSTGVVSAVLREAYGSAVTVLDPSPDELAVAVEHGMEAIAGLAEEADLGDRVFDLVLLSQTIDHLLDIRSTLEAIRRWTAPGGRLFIDLVDVGYIARRKGRIEDAIKIDHPYYLTRETAEAYFQLSGFVVEAERLSDNGHWGFLLAPGAPVEPDWEALRRAAGGQLKTVWQLRATWR